MSLSKAKLFNPKTFAADLDGDQPPLEVFRSCLKQGRETLRAAHLKSAPGQDIVHHHAWLVDQLLIQAWTLYLEKLQPTHELALIAVGGYGRGELHPGSDVDLMFLLRGNHHKKIQPFSEAFLRFLWDMGLEVGHSVRSIQDCANESRKDITVATNILESRLLHGDPKLFQKMLKATAPPKIWSSKAFFEAKWQEQLNRHHRYHDTAYNLEPNLKEGPGGLRDIQMVGWVAKRHFSVDSIHDLVGHGFLTEEEYRGLIRGRNFLWRIRNGLHFLTDRREDRLLFDHQRSLAKEFGYKDRPGKLAVEQLMKRYYRTVKELALLNEILLQNFQEEILNTGKTKKIKINRRFRSHNGFLEVTSAAVFEHSPFAMLELFLLMETRPELKGVRASTIRLIQSNLHRIDAHFRKDIACRSLFMEIMRQPQGITHCLRRMNAYRVLGAYLPNFGRIVGQMQHDLFHVYTVDEHSLFVVRNLRRLAVPEFQHEFPLESTVISNLFKTERLYIAGLFHDIAKGRGGDHAKLGEKDVTTFCRQHDMSTYDTQFIAWLVRNHLIMSWTAQREDISDPDVVMRFAERVGEQERLDNLYLLTVADIRGTSPKVWNSWKGRLLSQLYTATTRIFRRGFSNPIRIEERVADQKQQALDIVNGSGATTDHIQQLWQTLGDTYFARYDAESIAWHAQSIAQTEATRLPLVAARYHPEHEVIEVLIYTPAKTDLFTTLTGGFDRMNLNIVDARLHSSSAGFALDTFVVLDNSGSDRSRNEFLSHIQEQLHQQILIPKAGKHPLQVNLPRALKQFPIPTRTQFSESANGLTTVLEVVAQDRPGLLHQVALALLSCKLRVQTAKVSTYGERAEDIFFITDRDNRPIRDPQLRTCVEKEIAQRLGQTTHPQHDLVF
ncbi:MAG: [protein-PII] uridylyltransferase [Gammaproteobacteria bacterium]|nr:[protein-PII] uridylyltransferase [Gammaproteobacteria bacterium]